MNAAPESLQSVFDRTFSGISQVRETFTPQLTPHEVGTITSVSTGVARVTSLPSFGCRLLDWKVHKVSLICFELEDHQMAHLLVVDSGSFKDSPPESPAFKQLGDVTTASWSRGGKPTWLPAKAATSLT